MSLKEIADAVLGPYGVLVLILAIGIAGAAGKWVWGWVYDQERAARLEWQTIAIDLLRAGHKAIDIVEEVRK